jgi:hypothetical protein
MSEFEEIDLTKVLEQPTTMRTEVASSNNFLDNFSALEFEGSAPKEKDDFTSLDNDFEEDFEDEDEEPHNPEEEAEKLVGLIQSANLLTMTPLAMWKARKKRGGKQAITRMQEVFAKSLSGQKLSPAEQSQVSRYNAYLRDKEELEKAIPYTPDEVQLLKKMAIPYMKTTKMRINGGFAFWTTLAGIQAQRIIAIIQA